MPGLDGLGSKKGQSNQERASRLPLIRLVLTAVFIALASGGSALLYQNSLSSNRTIPGVRLAQYEIPAMAHEQLAGMLNDLAARIEGRPVIFHHGKAELARTTLHKLGGSLDRSAIEAQLRSVGKSGDLVPDLIERIQARRGRLALPLMLRLDHRRARQFFRRLKGRLDQPPVKSRIDLARRKVHPGRKGYALNTYDALAATETALRAGYFKVVLPIETVEPQGQDVTKLTITHALGSFVTVYSQADKDRDRAYNLKLGASKLDGLILQPGDKLSFNKVVGPRTKRQGYRTAYIINQGELVDGMAGGSCQLSSTLFAAAFFAGLDLVSSRPHTIPSSYIKMGLDATVDYKTTDLVIANPYPFPVAVHFVVNQGKVRVEILGKPRPWRKVEFRRSVKKQEPFKEIIRDDPELPRGVKLVTQRGVPGFLLERQRLFFAKGQKPTKTESRELRYPPTVQIVRRGTGKPDPNYKTPPAKPPFGEVKAEYALAQ